MAPLRTRLAIGISARLRRLDARLHIDRRGGSEWIWALPIGTFVGIVSLFVGLGMTSGVWAAEYVPTGLVIALVISGLLVACTAPEDLPPWCGDDDDGRHRRPAPPPSPLDPTVWQRLLAEINTLTPEETGSRRAEDAAIATGRRP